VQTALPGKPLDDSMSVYSQIILVIRIIKANEIHYFSTLFGKELYMFWTDLLSIIRSLNTVFTAIGITNPSRLMHCTF